MAIDHGGLTTILHYLTLLPVSGEEPRGFRRAKPDPDGLNVVLVAEWLERRGSSETLISECWSPIARNMWLVTSKKK